MPDPALTANPWSRGLEAIFGPALVVGQDGRVEAANEEAQRWWPDAVGSQPSRLLDGADLAGVLASGGHGLAFAKGRDGRAARLEVRVAPVGDGRRIVTLQEPDAELLEPILRSTLHVAIYATDGKRITLWGAGAQRLFGHTRDEAVGAPLSLLGDAHPVQAREPARHQVRLRARGGAVESVVRAVPLRDHAGTVTGTLFLTQDVHEVQDLQQLRDWVEMEELRQMAIVLDRENTAMARANKLKTDFLANMSHELRTPLNSVLGFAKLLRSGRAGSLNDKQAHYLDRVLEGGEHLLRLISEILDLARIESGRIEFRPEDVDLVELAEATAAAIKPLADGKDLHVTFEAGPCGLEARLDPVRFKQVLYNYLSNAVKFTPKGGAIELRLRDEDGMVRVEVEDTGIGIPEERQTELFTEFAQLENPLSKEHPGAGLGLAITRRIVEALGGHVGVESTPGEGSTFYAVLPRYPHGA